MAREQVAVVAHAGKTLGGGLGELRQLLARAGHPDPLWYEVPKSRKAPKAVRRAVKKGARLIFVWGGDGMVQRCIDALPGKKKVDIAILPAGTANLLATHLGIPKQLADAVRVGLRGARRRIDAGVANGERFAVMAGAGFDALIMRSVSSARKKRLGRLAYFRSSVQAMRAKAVRMKIKVDGTTWFNGKASAVLMGNVGTITGGLTVFPAASDQDGLLEIGVVTARSAWQWTRVLSRVVGGHPDRSPFVEMTRGKKVVVHLSRRLPYELDGGDRKPAKRLEVRIVPGRIGVRAPLPPSARASRGAAKSVQESQAAPG
jgi:diacylglycerol kinase (ATP)